MASRPSLAGAGVAIALAVMAGVATGQEARAAVEAFAARLAAVEVRDVTIDQEVTVYHVDGVHVASRGHERLYLKPPGRHRQEQTIDGRREVRLLVGGRAWVRDVAGTVHEVPIVDRERTASAILVPLQRSAADLLQEWGALGIRDDVTHAARVGRRTVSVIGAGPGDRDSPAVWLDPEYGVVRIITRERTARGPGGRDARPPVLVDVALSEHRPLVSGFHFPWRQEVFVDGKLALRVIVRAITANRNIADALFDPDALRRER